MLSVLALTLRQACPCCGRVPLRRRLPRARPLPNVRRCPCGKALLAGTWFCSVACKAATAARVVGLGT
jgi:hypothetical protein